MARTSRKYPMLRRSRAMWGSRRVWQPRLVFWAGAIAIGLISVLFAVLADKAQGLFHMITGNEGRLAQFPAAGHHAAGFVALRMAGPRFFPGSQGSGIPQAIAARHLRDDEIAAALLSLRIGVGKIALTLVGLLCGASIGREGPTVQVGAADHARGWRAAAAWPARGLILAGGGRGRGRRLQHPARRHRLRHRGDQPFLRAAHQRLVLTRSIIAGLTSLAPRRQLRLFRPDHADLPTGARMDRGAGLRHRRRPARRRCSAGSRSSAAAVPGAAAPLLPRPVRSPPLRPGRRAASACASGGADLRHRLRSGARRLEGERRSRALLAVEVPATLASLSAASPAASSRRRWPSAPASARARRRCRARRRRRAARHGRLFRGRGAGADHRLRHHPGNDRRSRNVIPLMVAAVIGFGASR